MLDYYAEYLNVTPTNRILLLLDQHQSHFALQSVEHAKQKGFDVLFLPANTTFFLQPFD